MAAGAAAAGVRSAAPGNITHVLDGTWKVTRVSGALPPMLGVRKVIAGERGRTVAPGLPDVGFRVDGLKLRYGGVFSAVVDVLAPDGAGGYDGTMTVAGRAVARFRLTRLR